MSLFSGIAIGSGSYLGTATLVGSGPLALAAGAIGLIEGGKEVKQTIAGTNTWNGLDTYAGGVGGAWAGASAGMMVGGPIGAVAGGLLGLIGGGLVGSLWGDVDVNIWDNSAKIAGNRATESKQYQTVNRKLGAVKQSMGINKLSEADTWLKQKAAEQNTITQTIKTTTSSWFGASSDTDYEYRYWKESNDQLLGRYGYETYAQKASNLQESLKWMEVKDMDKLSEDVLLADIKDSAGQDIERQIAGNQMNNYFGQYYVDATKV